METRTGYMTEYTRPPHPTCQDGSACDRKVRLAIHRADGTLIGLYCQSDGVKALREHNRTSTVGTAGEARA